MISPQCRPKTDQPSQEKRSYEVTKGKKKRGRKLDTPSILLLNHEYCLSWSVQCALYKQAVYISLTSVLELELAELIKVSKFQKQIFLFSFEPKTQRNYFLLFALVSKKCSNQKTLLYDYIK